MSYNIYEQLSVLNEKTEKARSIVKKIEMKRCEYENIFASLTGELQSVQNEINELKSNVVTLRLGDLLDELSWLSGNSVNNIKTLIKFNMTFSSMDDFFSFIDGILDNGKKYLAKNVRFRLWCDLSKDNSLGVPFDYFTFFDLDLSAVQNDGFLLINHCLCEIEPYSNEELSVTFSIEKNISDILCDINLGDLKDKDNVSWYPADLFMQAVINSCQREYNRKVDKIRKRVK